MTDHHQIKTLQDILRAHLVVELSNPESLERTIESCKFIWIDDGKHDSKITVETVREEAA